MKWPLDMSKLTGRAFVHIPIFLLAPCVSSAQTFEVGVQAGYFLPAVEQFERDIPNSIHIDAHHNPGVVFAVNLTAWPLHHFGLDLAGALRVSSRTVTTNDPRSIPPGKRAVVSIFGVRLVGRTWIGATAIRVGAGPAVIHLGGSTYDGGISDISIADRTFGGGIILADATRSVGRLRLRIGVEDAFYRVTMVALPFGIISTARTPLQHDLAFSAGIVLRLR